MKAWSAIYHLQRPIGEGIETQADYARSNAAVQPTLSGSEPALFLRTDDSTGWPVGYQASGAWSHERVGGLDRVSVNLTFDCKRGQKYAKKYCQYKKLMEWHVVCVPTGNT